MAVGIGIQPKEYTEHYNLFGDYFYKVLKKPPSGKAKHYVSVSSKRWGGKLVVI